VNQAVLATDDSRVRRTPSPVQADKTYLTLRTLVEYQAGRRVIGQIVLSVDFKVNGATRTSDRQVFIWTLIDGEHLMMLTRRSDVLYWESSFDDISQLRSRGADWLSEPD
jgi:hypothetical protein